MVTRRLVAAVVLIGCLYARASGEPLPPPDPRLGERYDGRAVRARAGSQLLELPRLVLGIPLLLLKMVMRPIQSMVAWAERHALAARLYQALTSEDGRRGIRPNLGILLSFRPIFGFSLFDRATLGGGRWYTLDVLVGGQEVIEAQGSYTVGIRAGEAQYVRAALLGELVLALGGFGQVLALGARVEAMVHAAGPAVPFSERLVLGGPNDLRGARPGRFRGMSSLLATAEYRWPIWIWADATLFTDVGVMGDEAFRGMATERVRVAVGGGVRLVSRAWFVVRVQVAYGWGDGWQTWISAAPGW